MNRVKPYTIVIEVQVKDDMEAYDMVESILTDPRIKGCYIEPDFDEETVEQIADDIKRRATIQRIK